MEFLSAYGQLPVITLLDRFTMALEDVVDAQKDPYFNKLAAEAGIPENIASRTIQLAWGIPQKPNEKSISVPLPTSKSDQRRRDPNLIQSQNWSTSLVQSSGRISIKCGMKGK